MSPRTSAFVGWGFRAGADQRADLPHAPRRDRDGRIAQATARLRADPALLEVPTRVLMRDLGAAFALSPTRAYDAIQRAMQQRAEGTSHA